MAIEMPYLSELPLVYEIPILIMMALVIFIALDHVGIGPFAPKIIPGFPYVRGYPIVGVLYQVNNNPAKKYEEWSHLYNADVFQMRMGSRVVLVANSFESVKELWITHSDATNSRPLLHTFHTVVSQTQGFTVGTTPFGESYKNKKKVIATALNKRSVELHSSLIGDESRYMFKRIFVENQHLLQGPRDIDLDLFKLLQGYVLRISLYLTYGFLVKVDHDDKCKLFDEITHVENMIVKLRGHSSNVQDYLSPFLRCFIFDDKTQLANEYRQRRDVYMTKFINDFKLKMSRGEDVADSIVSRVLNNSQEFHNVSDVELTSVCLTMVSAGLDNTPLVLNHILGHLSRRLKLENGNFEDSNFQKVLLKQIVDVYGTLENAFHECSTDDKTQASYVVALIEEALRYFSVLPTSLPRRSSKNFYYKGNWIPKGTIFFMNAYYANHDFDRFDSPFQFDPTRHLADDLKLAKGSGGNDPRHFAFGAGTRVCGGIRLAMKEIYVALVRFIVLYDIFPPRVENELMGLDPFETNSCANSVAIEPFPFKMRLEIRDKDMFGRLVLEEQEPLSNLNN